MKITAITSTFAVASQPSEAEIIDLGGRDFSLLINNRPDGEEPGQPGSKAEADAAKQVGLSYLHLPVTGGSLTRGDVERFRRAVDSAAGPVVAHCRSGTRSLTLWAIGEVLAGNLSRNELPGYGAQKGIDLTGALRWLEANEPA